MEEESLHDQIVKAIEGITEPIEIARATANVIFQQVHKDKRKEFKGLHDLVDSQERLIEQLQLEIRNLRKDLGLDH